MFHLIYSDAIYNYPETTLAAKCGIHQKRLHLQIQCDIHVHCFELFRFLPTPFHIEQNLNKNLMEKAVNHSQELCFHLYFVRSLQHLHNDQNRCQQQ